MILVLEEPTSTVNLIEQVVTVFEIADFNIPSGIGEDIFTAAGQLIVALAGSSPTTLDEPGADGLVLTSNPSAAKKLEWRAAAAGGGGGSLTNKRGTAVVAGNVVILDTTNNEAFKTTTTDTDPLVIGVASEAISNNAAGNVLRVGKSTVLVQGNVAYGDWLVTSTTDGRAKSAGATKPNRGGIGKALSAYAGGGAGSVTAWISVDWDVTPIPSLYERDTKITGGASTSATTRRTLVITPASSTIAVNISGAMRIIPASQSMDLDTAGNWDSATYATAANRAGKDFYIYACENGGATAPLLILSNNATTPASGTTPRKIGGFHCLCVNVGTIAGHTLTGYIVGDILPQSVWDLKWKPKNITPEGMIYSPTANIWVDIYLLNSSYTSTYATGAGALVSTNWMNFVDGVGSVGKRLLRDFEFQLIAAGGNEQTNITGSAWTATRGGHVDTASRRMISNIGCEDCAGLIWQWLDEQSYWYAAPAAAWFTTEGSKGQMYMQHSTGDVKLLAGGYWAEGTYCGSRSRNAFFFRWDASTAVGGRAGVEPG